MATRTIANGGGNWNAIGTWVEGAVPTSADEVVATATSGNLTINAAAACRSIDLTGYVGTVTHNAAITLTIGDGTAPTGNNALVFPSSGWTYTLGDPATSAITFASTSATQLSVDPGGKTFGNVTFNGNGGSWALASDLTSSGAYVQGFGTFNANGKNVTVATFASNNTNTRTITMGSGTWTLTGSGTTIWGITNVTNLTFNNGNPIICNYSGSTGTRTLRQITGIANPPSFKVTAGTDTLTIFNAASLILGGLILDGFAGTFANIAFTCFGDFTITSNSSDATISAGNNAITFGATSGTKTISSVKTLDFPITINGVGGTFQLGANLTMGSARALTITNGTFDANNFNVDCGSVSTSNSNTRSILMGSGTWTLRATGTAWNAATSTGLTVTPSTSTVTLANSGTQTFSGGGKTYYALNLGAAGAKTIVGSNTFSTFTRSVSAATSITFTDGTTTTVTNSLTLTGSAGQLLTLQGSSTGGWTLAVPSTQSISYVSVSRSTATGNTALAGTTSTDGGNNTNWNFGPPVNSVAPSCTPSSGTTADTFNFSPGTWTGSPTSYETSVSVDGGAYSVIDTSAGGTPAKTGAQLGGPGTIATRVRAENAGGWSDYVAGTTLTVTTAGGSGSRMMLLGVG